MRRGFLVSLLVALAALAVSTAAIEYSGDSTIVLPQDYRQWVFVTSSVGMSYISSAEPAANPRFENVFVNPEAYQAFLKTGTWPDKTVLVLEIRGSDTAVSINKSGRVQTVLLQVEAHVKNKSRGGWAFYRFGNGSEKEGTLIPKSADCYSCHEQNAAVDTTFVQFYSTLAEIAKAKGTFAEKPDAAKNDQPDQR